MMAMFLWVRAKEDTLCKRTSSLKGMELFDFIVFLELAGFMKSPLLPLYLINTFFS